MTIDERLEAAAKAIYDIQKHSRNRSWSWDILANWQKNPYRAMARAAIVAYQVGTPD